MRFVIRADASHEIGTGHVMRCLTLAKKLKQRKHEILFVCKKHQGHLNELIAHFGFSQISLNVFPASDLNGLQYAHWIGGDQQQDAKASVTAIQQHFSTGPDWIIVDHYGLDSRWHRIVKNHFEKVKIMVIDDLGDRQHCCNLLLDQTYGRSEEAYSHLIPQGARQLLGSTFALLRDEFSVDSGEVLRHRKERMKTGLGKVLIMMGGTDHLNKSALVLNAVEKLAAIEQITVVLGPTSVHQDEVGQMCQGIDHASLIVGSNNISQLLLEHDVCIGAAGSSAWERCALGLPGVIMAFADNQKIIANNLSAAGVCVPLQSNFYPDHLNKLIKDIFNPKKYLSMVRRSLEVCDGQGVGRTVEILEYAAN